MLVNIEVSVPSTRAEPETPSPGSLVMASAICHLWQRNLHSRCRKHGAQGEASSRRATMPWDLIGFPPQTVGVWDPGGSAQPTCVFVLGRSWGHSSSPSACSDSKLTRERLSKGSCYHCL